MFGRVYLGLGSKAAITPGKHIPEDRETEGPHRRIPAVMIFPAFLLVTAALALTLTPHLQHATLTAARTMADSYAYQARVLDARHIPNDAVPETNSPLKPTLISSLSSMTAGLLLAGWALSPAWPRRNRAIAPAQACMRGLHSLHSGHVGDYVAFLTFGAAAFGIILGLLIHRFGM